MEIGENSLITPNTNQKKTLQFLSLTFFSIAFMSSTSPAVMLLDFLKAADFLDARMKNSGRLLL